MIESNKFDNVSSKIWNILFGPMFKKWDVFYLIKLVW